MSNLPPVFVSGSHFM